MIPEVRFSDFLRAMSVSQKEVSFNDLAKLTAKKAEGEKVEKISVSGQDIYRILGPYASVRFIEQVKAVVPLAFYLMFFQMFILRQSVADAAIISGGLMAVMIGLMLFMEGLKLGLMPFGETIGNILPVKSTLPVVLTIAFLLGVGVTFAEPAIGALKAAGRIVSVEKSPYLYALLNVYSGTLVLMVGAGVGLSLATAGVALLVRLPRGLLLAGVVLFGFFHGCSLGGTVEHLVSGARTAVIVLGGLGSGLWTVLAILGALVLLLLIPWRGLKLYTKLLVPGTGIVLVAVGLWWAADRAF